VLVGRMVGAELVYETVNACIRFLASVDCQHVVTIEHLTNNYKGLHPVQNAMIQEHGSQCGFCTPGIVMSLYALWMETPKPSVDQIERALQGNLCRCTGYAPILRAAQSISGNPENDPLLEQRAEVSKALLKMNAQERVELDSEEGQVIVPADLDDFASVLAENPDATIVAGATDVGLWVTKFMQPISPVVHISHLQELRSCRVKGGELVVGAGVTYSEFESALRDHFSHLDGFWSRIGGWQVRNMGTIGGNIANGSPIGDTPPMLIALNASIMLRKETSANSVWRNGSNAETCNRSRAKTNRSAMDRRNCSACTRRIYKGLHTNIRCPCILGISGASRQKSVDAGISKLECKC